METRVRRVRGGRRALEDAGWRTWLSYRENHRRDRDGRMVAMAEEWAIELEHADGTVLTVCAPTRSAALGEAWCAVSRLERAGRRAALR